MFSDVVRVVRAINCRQSALRPCGKQDNWNQGASSHSIFTMEISWSLSHSLNRRENRELDAITTEPFCSVSRSRSLLIRVGLRRTVPSLTRDFDEAPSPVPRPPSSISGDWCLLDRCLAVPRVCTAQFGSETFNDRQFSHNAAPRLCRARLLGAGPAP